MNAGGPAVKIMASGDLDEYRIARLVESAHRSTVSASGPS